MTKRTPTTKDISLLQQLYKDGQVQLAPQFQRNAVWPAAAKAYLIDTILTERPMPLFFFLRGRSAKTGRPTYTVIDGQQRLRAIFDFIDDRFRLTQSDSSARFYRKKFSKLHADDKATLLNYDLIVEELSGYSKKDVEDVFVRMNKYVVKLSRQELRNAQKQGAFHNYATRIGKWPFWSKHKVFSPKQTKRMLPIEFAAEVVILLIEGEQDKKAAVDLYYQSYQAKFPEAKQTEKLLHKYLDWIAHALPNLAQSRFHKPVDLYSLIGALSSLAETGKSLSKLNPTRCGNAIRRFEAELANPIPTAIAAKYLIAASQQTDNVTPRTTRREILEQILKSA